MNDYDRAEYEAEMAQEAAAKVSHLVGEECGWCGETIETPFIVDADTPYEDHVCSEDCAEHARYVPSSDYEDFRADWDPYYQEEPEWDDRTGERIY